MADPSPSTETTDASTEHAEADKRSSDAADADAGAETDSQSPRRRKVYESTLIPERKRVHVSRWLIVVVVVALVSLVVYVTQTHHQRVLSTAGQVAYAVGSSGKSQLWITKPDGGGSPVALTSAVADDESPVFSPDGNQIAFISSRTGGVRQVFTMDADGKNVQQTTRTAETKALLSFAPGNSRTIGFTAGGILYVYDLAQEALERLLPQSAATHGPGQQSGDQFGADQSAPIRVTEYDWLPGTEENKQGLAAVLESNGVQTFAIMPSLSNDPITGGKLNGQDVPFPTAGTVTLGWSPNGGLLAVATIGEISPSGPAASEIVLFDSSGKRVVWQDSAGSPRQTVVAARAVDSGPMHPVFSPKGDQIVFEAWDLHDAAHRQCLGLFWAPVTGGTLPTPIVKGDAEKVKFLSDETLLYLSKRADGGNDLCQVQLDGTGFKRISDGTQDVTDFTISPQKPASK